MLSFPRLSKVSPSIFICIHTPTHTQKNLFLSSLKTYCLCLYLCYCFGLSAPSHSSVIQDEWGIKKANACKYWLFPFGLGLFDAVRENLFLFSVTELWTNALSLLPSLSALPSQRWKIWLGTSVKAWTTPAFYEALYGELGLCHFLEVFERSLSAVLSKVWSLTKHIY